MDVTIQGNGWVATIGPLGMVFDRGADKIEVSFITDLPEGKDSSDLRTFLVKNTSTDVVEMTYRMNEWFTGER